MRFSLFVTLALAATLPSTAGLAQAAPDGAKIFNQKCAVCHWPPEKTPEQARLGPGLAGIVGRPAASNAKFTRYSKAMKSSGKVWNEETLNAYLEAPTKVVPGTTMVFAGLKSPEERAAVINYLKSAAPK